MPDLGPIETTFWPRARAHRAFCEAEILARAAALILRGPCDTRPPLNQCNKRSQSIVNLIALLRAESAAFLYQVLTNRLMCGFYTLRKLVRAQARNDAGLAI